VTTIESAADALAEAKRIATTVLAPNAAHWDQAGLWPVEGLDALRAAGLGGLVVHRDRGGLGLGMPTLLAICETLARADASTALCFGMHCVAAAVLDAKPTPWLIDAVLRPIVEGRHLTTLALSEAGTGSHFYLPQARLAHDGDDYRLTGEKCFVTNGGHCDSYVVSAVDGSDDAPPGHFSMLLLDGASPGVTWGPPWQGWGMRGNAARTMTLDAVSIARDRRLGEEGDQIWFVFHVVAPYFLVAMAGTYLGVAVQAVELTREKLTSRRYQHSGQTLSELPVLQHRMGTIWAQLQRTRQLCSWAAREADHGGPDALVALCAAKAEVAHMVVDVVNECMTLSGGAAYRDGSALERLLRDARAAHIMSPTTDLLYTWAGRALLGEPLLGT
jgi:alkylation response protein AidB-like acyl-CoA dehydrogenase